MNFIDLKEQLLILTMFLFFYFTDMFIFIYYFLSSAYIGFNLLFFFFSFLKWELISLI